MGETLAISVVIKAIDQITAPMKKIGSALGNMIGLNKLPEGAKLAGGVLLGVAAAAVGVGVASVKMAGDFQAGTTTLVTSAGESAKAVYDAHGRIIGGIDMVRDGILNMAVQVGTGTKQLTSGMYMVESAGFHGAAGLDVLKNSAMGAKAEGADLATVTNAVTTVMNDFGLKSGQSSIAVNTLIATVSNGKTTLQALSGALSQVLPSASAAKVGLNDTMAAMATMTSEGVPAANAATFLRQTIIALVAPSKGTVTALKGIGLSSKQVSDEMKVSLPGALQMITDHLKKKFPEGSAAYVAALKNIAGGSKQMQGMLDLTGDHLKTFKNNVTNIAGAVKTGGKSIMGWSEVQGTFNFKMSQAKAALETLMIKIGTALLPVVSQLLTAIVPVITRFTDWLVKSNAIQNALTFLGSVLSTTGQIIGVVISFIAQVVQSIITWNNQTHFLQNAIAFVQTVISDTITVIQWLIGAAISVYGWIANIGSVFQATGQIIGNVISAIVTWFNQWKPVILSVGGAILLFFLPALIKAGIEAAKTGAQIATKFIQSLIASGTQAAKTGAIQSATFIKSMIQTGIQTVKTSAIIAVKFVQSMIMTAVQAVKTAAVVSAKFVWSLIQTGIEGWKSAGKLGILIGQMIATGAKAAWSAAVMAGKFVWSLIQAGAAAVATGAKFVASLIPSIVSFATTAITAAATAIPAILTGFASWAVGAFTVAAANIAAFWPVYLIVGVIIGVIALVVLAVKNWGAIAKWLQGVWSGIKSFFVGLWNGIVGLFQGAVSKLGGAMNVLKIIAIVAFAPIALPIMGIIALIQHWGQIMGWLGGIVKGAIGAIGGMVQGALSWITGLFTSAEDKAKQAKIAAEMHALQMKDTVLKNTQEMAVKSVANLTKEANGIAVQLEHCKNETERKHLEMKLAAVKQMIAQREAVVRQIALQRQQIKQHMLQLEKENEEAHKNIFQHAWDWTTRMVSGVQQKFQGMKDWLNGLLKNLVNDLLKIWKNISDGVQNGLGGLGKLVQNIWDGVKNAFKGSIDWIISGINSFIGFVNGISIPIPAINVGPIHLGGGNISLPKIPLIPLLATGGIVTRGGLAGINERAIGAEVVKLPTGAAVYPHGSVPAEAMGGGGRPVINYYNNITINAPNANAREIEKRVEDLLTRKLRRSTNLVTMSSGGRSAQ